MRNEAPAQPAPGRWLTLDGLRGHVEAGRDEKVRRRSWLSLANSPDLAVLDLSGHPGRIDLQLCESAMPETVILPKGGAFVHLRCSGSCLPDLEIHGAIQGCLVEHAGDDDRPAAHRAFLLGDSSGLVLQSDDPVEPRPGIQRHVRLDQSDRGLQVKDLRRGVAPGQVLWRLVEAARADRCPRTRLLWLARQPGRLDDRILGESPELVRLRRDLLQAMLEPPPVDRPFATDRLPMDNLVLLAWLARSGQDLESLWLLRCGLQHLVTEQPGEAGSIQVTNSASPYWPHRTRRHFRIDQLPAADLCLHAQCQHLPSVRVCNTRLGRLQYPSQVLALAMQAGHPETTPAAVCEFRSRLTDSIANLRRCAAADCRRDPQVHGGEWSLDHVETRALDELATALAVLGHEPAIEGFMTLGDKAFSCGRRIEHGIIFHRHGLRQGRHLLARCLESGGRISEDSRRRAMECLLSPLPTRSDVDLPSILS
ncbi:MAG: hypothetical protein EA370_13475 [Wenzhouxiangella sp.]|nr:MAG: hypothetical protein EA370_13475 [Wenzhouxiangella sp.]